MNFTAEPNLPLSDIAILVVEDEVLVAMAISSFLSDAGSQHIDIAASLAEADEMLLVSDYDAAILDIRLRDGISYGLAKRLTKMGIAVLFHSGHAEGKDVADQPKTVFCSKPATPNQLVQGILDASRLVHL